MGRRPPYSDRTSRLQLDEVLTKRSYMGNYVDPPEECRWCLDPYAGGTTYSSVLACGVTAILPDPFVVTMDSLDGAFQIATGAGAYTVPDPTIFLIGSLDPRDANPPRFHEIAVGPERSDAYFTVWIALIVRLSVVCSPITGGNRVTTTVDVGRRNYVRYDSIYGGSTTVILNTVSGHTVNLGSQGSTQGWPTSYDSRYVVSSLVESIDVMTGDPQVADFSGFNESENNHQYPNEIYRNPPSPATIYDIFEYSTRVSA